VNIATESAPLLGPVPEDSDLRTVLRSAEAEAVRQLLEVTEQLARIRERLAAIEAFQEQLLASEGECPVCRRPLDDQSRVYATAKHERDHAAAAKEMEAIDTDTASTLALQLRQLAERAEALGDPPAETNGDPVDTEALSAMSIQATTTFENALMVVGQARQIVKERNAKVDDIKALIRTDSSVRLHTKVAALETAKAALEATISQVLESQLGPVSGEVNRRWDAIFPDRPGLRLDSSGRIARSFDDDEDWDLEFESFSAGEKVVATLLLRLATLTSTTDIPFCMIDEPLEHLDPEARSYVGRTLAYLGSGTALQQLFVTTYEQDLALNLASRGDSRVHLEFLKTAHVSQ
jgi:DNA repair exonuclease SbcCD ATPase subunit